MAEQTTTTAPQASWAPGALSVVAIGLLTFLASNDMGIGAAAGYAVGSFVRAVALALPVFIVLRWGTRQGRGWATAKSINVFCFCVVGMWLAFALVKGLLASTVPAPMQ